MTIKTDKTIYDKPDASDGVRVLVMRLWPRGISKEKVDLWLKDLGTEKELIALWKKGKLSWKEYSRRYLASLKGKESTLEELAARSKKETITLLCVEKDASKCHRSLLRQQIEKLL
jgi:uncharacterized protein YeaO (DUF488 family)